MSLLLDLIYLIVLILLSPWLLFRARTTGRYRNGLRAKLLGLPTFPHDSSRPTAWFHGVSVGEIHLLGTLVRAFRHRHLDWRIVISSTTDTGLSEARARFPDDSVIVFPFDFSWAVRQTLLQIQPRIVILAESELWPNFLAIAGRRNIPVVVVNARMSPRSFARLTRIRPLAERVLLRPVRAFAAQNDEIAERLHQLGVPRSRLTVTGSVKYDGASGDRVSESAVRLRLLLARSASDRVWVAGSTHAPEESLVLEVFRRLRHRYPDLHLILVPRHPDRFEEVAHLLETSGIPFVRRSRILEPLSEMPAIVLLDTIGELGAAWALADVGFTGGSLDGQRGGQSMIEPAGYGVPVVFGPHIWNFRDAANRLLERGGAVLVRDAESLEKALSELLEDATRREQMGLAAQHLVREQQGATERTLDLIDSVLNSQS